MKLSLAFVALTAAADSQAPVISLNLNERAYSVRSTAGKQLGYIQNGDSYEVDAHYKHANAGNTTDFDTYNDATKTRHTHAGSQNTPDPAGSQNSFADECEVEESSEDHCQEPVASAYDHHDGDITTSIQTTYTLFVKSAAMNNPVKEETHQESINTKMRGEWVITYDVKDVAGNAAEQVQFALIMIDTKDPIFQNSPAKLTSTTKCPNKNDCEGGNYIHKPSADANTIHIELCGGSNTTGYYIQPTGAALTSTDAYDGSLTQLNSIMSFKIQTVTTATLATHLSTPPAVSSAKTAQDYTGYSFGNTDGFNVPEKFFTKSAGKFQSVDLNYELYSADFADIFGTGNENNFVEESGTVTIEDTIHPTIYLGDADASQDPSDYTYATHWECGYPAFDYRASSKDKQYGDCFDNTVESSATLGSVQITLSCDQGGNGLIDEISNFATATVPSKTGDHTNSDAQRICLGLGGVGVGKNHENVVGTGRKAYRTVNENSIGHTHNGTHNVNNANWNKVTLTYTLEDSFGNANMNHVNQTHRTHYVEAPNGDAITREVTITDNIAPTLYITQKQIRTHGFNNNEYTGDHVANTCTTTDSAECKCDHRAEVTNANGDVTSAHCVQNHHVDADGTEYTTYDHVAHGGDISHSDVATAYGQTHLDANEAGISAYNDELKIQHSAGYAQDYKYVQELMEEGNGYGCYDRCSTTTTTVKWQTACNNTATGSEFNMLKPGTYYLKYECKDQSANTATACRTFVNVDKTRPVITVLQAANENDGTWHVEASRDNNYVDAGATCSDMVDGNISQDVEVSGDVVNMAAVGTYKINYNCEDSAGQTAVQATRTVVVQDKTCPTCTIPGGSDQEQITVEASFPYTEEPSTCTDTLDGAMPNAHIYGHVDVEETGIYVLTYSVTDKNGNGNGNDCLPASGDRNFTTGSDHFTKTVVVEDTMIPIISLKYRGTDLVGMMAEQSTTTVNGWVIGAVASAVSGVALLGYAATRKATVATSVPV